MPLDLEEDRMLNEVRHDIKVMAESITRLSTLVNEWAPTWHAQGNGLADIFNRQTKIDGRLDAISMAFENDRQYRSKLEEISKSAATERAEGRKWTIGTFIAICALTVSIIALAVGHGVTIK